MPESAQGGRGDGEGARDDMVHRLDRSWAHRFIVWFFSDRRSGRITIVQFPNLPLWIFLVSVIWRWVVPSSSHAHAVGEAVGLIGLGWWAADEVLRGVNPWRRLLGAGGLLFVVSGIVSFVR